MGQLWQESEIEWVFWSQLVFGSAIASLPESEPRCSKSLRRAIISVLIYWPTAGAADEQRRKCTKAGCQPGRAGLRNDHRSLCGVMPNSPGRFSSPKYRWQIKLQISAMPNFRCWLTRRPRNTLRSQISPLANRGCNSVLRSTLDDCFELVAQTFQCSCGTNSVG